MWKRCAGTLRHRHVIHRRLTKEELERRSKENMLTEVGGKALEAEEQVKVLRQRINEMEEQMKKTEEVYKEQVDSYWAVLRCESLNEPVQKSWRSVFS